MDTRDQIYPRRPDSIQAMGPSHPAIARIRPCSGLAPGPSRVRRETYLQLTIVPSGLYFTEAPLVNCTYRTPSWQMSLPSPVTHADARSKAPQPVVRAIKSKYFIIRKPPYEAPHERMLPLRSRRLRKESH